MIGDMKPNKNLSPIVTELVLRGRTLNISLAFVSQSYVKVNKPIRLIATLYFARNILIKREHQLTASNLLSDIKCKDFMKSYKGYIKEVSLFLVNDTTLPSDNPLKFRKNLLQNYCQ